METPTTTLMRGAARREQIIRSALSEFVVARLVLAVTCHWRPKPSAGHPCQRPVRGEMGPTLAAFTSV